MRVIAQPVPILGRLEPIRRVGVLAWLQLALAAVVALLSLQLVRPASSVVAGDPVAAHPASWLDGGTLLTLYGRGFGMAPVLGDLGRSNSFAQAKAQLEPDQASIEAATGRPVRLAIHLIYGLATPCASAPKCVLYLDDLGVNIVQRYIEPAARRGWLVILDDQLGRSTPAAEIRRMMRRGYLAYDNVEVAFDPEFHTAPGQTVPGSPPGTLSAHALNHAARLMNAAAARAGLAHRKLLLVHEWFAGMIRHPSRLRTTFRYVRPVTVMDGIGSPADKTRIYHLLLEPAYRRGVMPGIKLFPQNAVLPFEKWDQPLLSWTQLLRSAPVPDEYGRPLTLTPAPRVIVMT